MGRGREVDGQLLLEAREHVVHRERGDGLHGVDETGREVPMGKVRVEGANDAAQLVHIRTAVLLLAGARDALLEVVKARHEGVADDVALGVVAHDEHRLAVSRRGRRAVLARAKLFLLKVLLRVPPLLPLSFASVRHPPVCPRISPSLSASIAAATSPPTLHTSPPPHCVVVLMLLLRFPTVCVRCCHTRYILCAARVNLICDACCVRIQCPQEEPLVLILLHTLLSRPRCIHRRAGCE
jgi:hypothetical protein